MRRSGRTDTNSKAYKTNPVKYANKGKTIDVIYGIIPTAISLTAMVSFEARIGLSSDLVPIRKVS